MSALYPNIDMLGDALVTTFKQYLGKHWTREVKQAWVDAYVDITALMLKGAKYDGETVKLEAPGEKRSTSQVPQTHEHKAEPAKDNINWPILGGIFGVAGAIIIVLLLL